MSFAMLAIRSAKINDGTYLSDLKGGGKWPKLQIERRIERQNERKTN